MQKKVRFPIAEVCIRSPRTRIHSGSWLPSCFVSNVSLNVNKKSWNVSEPRSCGADQVEPGKALDNSTHLGEKTADRTGECAVLKDQFFHEHSLRLREPWSVYPSSCGPLGAIKLPNHGSTDKPLSIKHKQKPFVTTINYHKPLLSTMSQPSFACVEGAQSGLQLSAFRRPRALVSGDLRKDNLDIGYGSIIGYSSRLMMVKLMVNKGKMNGCSTTLENALRPKGRRPSSLQCPNLCLQRQFFDQKSLIKF